MKPRVLLVDDDRAFRLSTSALLEGDFDVTDASDAPEAMAALERDPYDLVIMDVRMPGVQGIDLVEVLRAHGRGMPILMISGFGTVDTAVRALHVGADDFLTKPVEPEELRSRAWRLIDERPRLAGGERTLLGKSPGIVQVVSDIEQVAPSDTTVLVTGETGTGKELVARSIHARSSRSGKPFVTVNSAGLSEGILESQLFGHLKGAFTGADRNREGLFDAADGGTLFLDEVGDMSMSSQKRLLRVLQEGEVLPVGAVAPHSVNVRVVAATHRDLRADVESGRFREDLYYRLNVFGIHLPPLRERTEDIPLLVAHYMERVEAGPGATVSPLAMRRLLEDRWAGNVRQLFAALESAHIRSGGGTIHVHHLPAELRDAPPPGKATPRYDAPRSPADERSGIVAALEQSGGRKAEAARLLGMSRTTLWRKLREYGLDDSNGGST